MDVALVIGANVGTITALSTLMFYMLKSKQDVKTCDQVQETNKEGHRRLDTRTDDLKDYIEKEFTEVKQLIRNNHGN